MLAIKRRVFKLNYHVLSFYQRKRMNCQYILLIEPSCDVIFCKIESSIGRQQCIHFNLLWDIKTGVLTSSWLRISLCSFFWLWSMLAIFFCILDVSFTRFIQHYSWFHSRSYSWCLMLWNSSWLPNRWVSNRPSSRFRWSWWLLVFIFQLCSILSHEVVIGIMRWKILGLDIEGALILLRLVFYFRSSNRSPLNCFFLFITSSFFLVLLFFFFFFFSMRCEIHLISFIFFSDCLHSVLRYWLY